MDPITQNWLELQCHYTEHVASAVVFLGGYNTTASEPVAWWPADKKVSGSLCAFVKKQLGNGLSKTVIKPLENQNATVFIMPIAAGGQTFGCVAMVVKGRDQDLLKKTVKALDWGCEWFVWLAKERKSAREQDGRLLKFVDIVALALKYEDLQRAAQIVVDGLRERIGCARICIGMIEAGRIGAIALSGAQPGEDLRAFARPLRDAMEEGADQQATICVGLNAVDSGVITRSHESLLTEHQVSSACSVPMIHNGLVVAVLTCEGLEASGLDATLLNFLEQVALMLGPILAMKQAIDQQDHPLSINWSSRKKLIAGVVALLIALMVIPVPYEISTTAVVESDRKQLVLAPLDGYIADAEVRAGDRVKRGEVLAHMEDGDLQLEYKKWQGKKNQYLKSYNNALGSLDRTEISIAKAQLDQAQAELSLLEKQLARTALVAPFDGVVVAGDLSQSLGAPVKRGDLLFEIAPELKFRLLLKVDERDIVRMQPGQSGEVRLASLPGDTIDFSVTRVVPVSTTVDGSHYFHVEAQFLETDDSRLSPGMTGVGKVRIGNRPYLWIWFHNSVDWLRLWYWRM